MRFVKRWAGQGNGHPEIGGLYSIEWGDGSFGVVKLLKTDKQGAHLRFYSNVWSDRPSAVDSSSLVMSRIDEPGLPALGHVPVTLTLFEAFAPIRAGSNSVTKQELDGYEEWKRASGGYFGSFEEPLLESAMQLHELIVGVVRDPRPNAAPNEESRE